MRVLLLSCYELGHVPLGLARPLGALRAAGVDAEAIDLAIDALDEARVRAADLVAISVPMHTALRLGARVAKQVRELNARARLVYYGLYAGLNEAALDADAVIGAEGEAQLVALALGQPPPGPRGKLPIATPDRRGLAPLDRYARAVIDGEERLAGYVEGTTGCKYHCRHCPIPPVYGGRFFVNPVEDVMADVAGQVAAGARHITFGDPDFLNGPGHAMRLVRALHDRFPGVTFDVTAKIEHLLKQAHLLPQLRAAGCAFVVSAVESLSDRVLEILDKGHSRADVFAALELLRAAGLALRPSFVPFTPWSTVEDYRELLDWIDREDLVDHVDSVQLTIRLLVPPGSLLEHHEAMRPHLGQLRPEAFAYEWKHPDSRMDELHGRVFRLVQSRMGEEVFADVRALAGLATTPRARKRVPRLTEPWFC